MRSKPTAIFVPPLEAEPEGTVVRVSSRETDGAFCVCEMTTPPGDGVPLHVHDRDEEFYYILEGALDMRAGDERFTAAAGSIVVIPRDVPHTFHNAGDVPVRALMIFRPGGFDEMLEELHDAREPVDEGRRRDILAKGGVRLLDEENP